MRSSRWASVALSSHALACGLDTFGMGAGNPATYGTTAASSTSDSTATSDPTSTNDSTTSSASTMTTTEATSTGGPVDPTITFRIDQMEFIDPHLFITDGDPDSCVNDVTPLVNTILNGDIADRKFNLLFRFENFGQIDEMRMFEGDCAEPMMPDGMPECSPNDAAPAVILVTEIANDAGCRELEPNVYAEIALPLVNDPLAPCLRTKRAAFSLPIGDMIDSLDLREAQIVAALDSVEVPTRLFSGVVYGFLTMAAAQSIEIEAPLFGLVDLWSVIDAEACMMEYPDYLPSVDMLEINDVPVPGAWIAINFTAEKVVYHP